MILCSCAVITDADIEQVLIEILQDPNGLIPTPGVVFRRLKKKMKCCGCAPLTVEFIYEKVIELEHRGLVEAAQIEFVREKLQRNFQRQRRQTVQATPARIARQSPMNGFPRRAV